MDLIVGLLSGRRLTLRRHGQTPPILASIVVLALDEMLKLVS